MLEDELRETLAAKAGSPPPGSLASLNGFADTAIQGAARIRRRRRAAVTGLSGFAVVAAAAVVVLHTLSPGGPVNAPLAEGRPQTAPEFSSGPSGPSSRTSPEEEMREVPAIGPSAQAATKVRLQAPARSTVTAAYQANDGYLMVNTQPDGDKQLVLQNDDEQQQVLVDDASNIAVAKDGRTVAWASQGRMNVGTRSDDNSKKIAQNYSAPVPEDTDPVVFVGTTLVISSDNQGFDAWHTEREYKPRWDKTVVRVFGGTADSAGVYAEIDPAAGPNATKGASPSAGASPPVAEPPMCLALLRFDQPFKVADHVCGLPIAAEEGARISPDGHWLAYPILGDKQVAILDLTSVFKSGKAKTWDLTVTGKTAWLNPTTFVVDDGKQFLKLDPGGKDNASETLDADSDGVVLIEPLAAQ
ncbi:hypothetical protein [Dactylosporangium sp. CA-092794]|uniref:hypothetical protein n=1 Tax=Dactylosporangium sp. CA-092794 TaxID=3239929 RepID=UPI003D8EBDBA